MLASLQGAQGRHFVPAALHGPRAAGVKGKGHIQDERTFDGPRFAIDVVQAVDRLGRGASCCHGFLSDHTRWRGI